MAGIEKENRIINKPVLMYGVIISIIYMVYLYIIGETSIYRYVIYLVSFILLLLINTIILKKNAKDNYITEILMILIIMAVFTGEYTVICTIILTLLSVAIALLIKKLTTKKTTKVDKTYYKELNIGLFLSISNILCLILFLYMSKFI